MTGPGRRLLEAHRSELAARVEAIGQRVADLGADAECARRAHALKGAALTVGLDDLAVAASALEVSCDEDGGDAAAALRAIDAGRRALHAGDLGADARMRHDLRGLLNIVVGHASLLELEPLTSGQRDSVHEIIAAADAMTAFLASGERSTGDQARPAGPLPAPADRRVLLVEDDAIAADVVARMLSELGATVAVARSAADALRAATAERPDLVVLDLGLPDADGREVLRALRATPGLEHLPVVVSSGEAGAAVGSELAAHGATALLPKPVTMDSLRALLSNLTA